MAIETATGQNGFEFFAVGPMGEIETRRTSPGCYPTYAEAVEASASLRAKTIADLEARVAELKAID